jgi:N-acetylmuramoyl-L-alanine amidase
MKSHQEPDSPLALEFIASPNHGERRGYLAPDCVILHYTGMATGSAALKQLCNPAAQVSSHYFIWEDGGVIQLVAENRRAWHAGHAFWKGARDLNSASIGIEIVNCGHEELPPYPHPQIEAVIALARDIGARCAIAPERILAHSDIAPSRKRDPGEHFPWEALWRAGIGHWTPPPPADPDPLFAHAEEGPPVRALQAMLALYGYGVELTGVYDHQTRIVVAAFQRHFRPERVDGETDSSTIQTLRALFKA